MCRASCTAIRRMPRRSRSPASRFRRPCCRKSKSFLGEVPIAPYETPGGKKFAETILPFVHKSNVIILANHGTVSLRRIRRASVLVDGNPRRLLPHSDPGPPTRADPLSSPQKTQELIDLRRSGASPTRASMPISTATFATTPRFATPGRPAASSREHFLNPAISVSTVPEAVREASHRLLLRCRRR